MGWSLRGGAMLQMLLLHCGSADRRALLVKRAPINGASYNLEADLKPLPPIVADQEDPLMTVTRLLPNVVNTKEAEACGGGQAAGKGACLNKPGRECMWVSMIAKTIDGMNTVKSHCLPCVVDGEDIPCWAPGSNVDGGFVITDCEMRCPHQKTIAEPGYACTDESGFITQPQCFDRGVKSGSKCMFHSYVTADGKNKSICGPCTLPGIGGWGCTAVGDKGPEPDSKVTFCLSQCDVICMGPPDCPPTIAPPPPPPPPSPGIVVTESDPKKMLIAPRAFAMPTLNPNHIIKAALDRKKVASWVSFCYSQCDGSCKIQPRCPMTATTAPGDIPVPTAHPYMAEAANNMEEVASWVKFCDSQCDFICSGPPYCRVEPPPMTKEQAMSPGANAPPTLGPYAIIHGKAQEVGVVDWPIGSPPPPQSYYPVVMYRSPMDYMYTPGPYSTWGNPSALLQRQREEDAWNLYRKAHKMTQQQEMEHAVLTQLRSERDRGGMPRQEENQPPPPKAQRTGTEESLPVRNNDEGDPDLLLKPKIDAPTVPPAQFPPKRVFLQAVSSEFSRWGVGQAQ